MAAAVAAGRIGAVETVTAALERVARLDGGLNAVVALRGEEALAEAEMLDRRRASGEPLGPLAGVPMLVKDLEDLTGMTTTKGSVLLAGAPPASSDGLVPGRLRAAGAIPIGKTNLPEFAIEGYTANALFGATGNPWGPDWSPGGSSGGSAAAVAAGMVPIATATDGGGSIRIPASLCGLVGLKPTNGLVGRRPVPDWIDLSTDGPFATCVEDLRLLLAVEIGPVAGDPTALPLGAPPAAAFPPPARLFAARRTSDLGPLPGPVAASLQAAVDALSDVLSLPVSWLEPDGVFTDGNPDLDWFTLCGPEHVASLGRDFVTGGLDEMHVGARNFLANGLDVGVDEYLDARRRRFSHVRALDLLLGDDALLVTPTVAVEGYLADGRLVADGEPGSLPAEVFCTPMQNITGHPAITVPAGLSGNGLPFGLQLTGPRYSDMALLEVAAAWEAAHPWPATAPGYEPFSTIL